MRRAIVAFSLWCSLFLAPTAVVALDACPYNANAVGLVEGQQLACLCGPLGTVPSVYGSDRYTGDSGLCAAAVHAGVVDLAGGTVTIYGGGACQSFAASERNGIVARAYGAYPTSFGFTDPLAPCAELAAGRQAAERLLRECRARGRDDAYCDCEIELLAARLGGGGVSLLHGITDEMSKPQKVSALAAAIAGLLSDRGFGLSDLPVLKESVGLTRTAVAEACGP
jgi:hypothetical protein